MGGIPTYSFVQGTVLPYVIYAVSFNQVQATGSSNAIAYIATSNGNGDQYFGTSTSSEVLGSTYDIKALGFGRVQAYFGGGTNQVAQLERFSGSDYYHDYGGIIEIRGTGYDNFAIGFSTVIASVLHPDVGNSAGTNPVLEM